MPGAGGVVVARDAGELWQRASPEDPARRGSGEKGVWSGRRPPDPPAPHPRRGCPIAHTTLGPRGTQRAAPAATAWRNEGRGAAGPPPPPHPHPPSQARPPRRPREPGRGPPAGPRRGRPTRPQAPVHPAHPRGAGDAGRRGRGDRPAGGRPGTRPALGRAHRSGGRGGGGAGGGVGGVAGAPPRPARDDVGGQAAAAAKRATDRGRGRPGEARHARARAPGSSRRGADRGGRTDGRTERGTDGVRPCDTNATEPAVEAGVAARHREGDGSKRPGGSESAARAHRGISPPEASQHRGGPEAHPERQTGLSGHPPPRGGEGAHPSRGLTPTANPTPGAAAGPGERSPAAYQRPPQPSHGQPCCARQGSPPLPRLPLRAPRALLHPGTPPADGGRETTPT